MKLIAFTIGAFVIENDGGTFIHRIDGSSSKLSQYAIGRLRDIGFHLAENVDISSIEEAKEIANNKMKEMKLYHE